MMSKFKQTSVIGMFLVLSMLLPDVAEARTCFFRSVDDIAFGTYTQLQAAPLDVRGSIRVRCEGRANPGQPNSYTIRITGLNNGGLYGRDMLSGINTLQYNLFKDAARTNVWGDGTFGTTPWVETFPNRNRINRRHWVYGRIPGGLAPEPGAYSDIVDVIIEF